MQKDKRKNEADIGKGSEDTHEAGEIYDDGEYVYLKPVEKTQRKNRPPYVLIAIFILAVLFIFIKMMIIAPIPVDVQYQELIERVEKQEMIRKKKLQELQSQQLKKRQLRKAQKSKLKNRRDNQ